MATGSSLIRHAPLKLYLIRFWNAVVVTTVCSQRSALLPAQKYASCGGGPLTAVLSIPCAVKRIAHYFT